MTSTRSAAATGLPISRTYLEALIEEAIAALDVLDGDPDLEETGDLEPSLGPDHRGCTDLEEDGADTEPSLGSSSCGNQEYWSQGIDEDDDDDAERNCDNDTDNTDDTPMFGRYDGLRMLHLEARETDRISGWLNGRVDSLRQMGACS